MKLTRTPARLSGRLALTASFALATAAMAQTGTPVFTNLWNIIVDSRPDLPSSGNNVRGTAVNPVTGNILFVSTAGGSNHVAVVDGNTGAAVGSLDATGVSGGGVALGAVRAGPDGAVYACSIAAPSASSGSGLRIYRWSSEAEGFTNPPVVIVNETIPATPTGARFGDAMDVRGAGTNTQIVLVGSGGARFSIVQPTEDTLTNLPWARTEMIFPSPSTFAGRGVAFDGTNNAIFGKTGGNTSIYRVAFDLANLTNWVTATMGGVASQLVGLDYDDSLGVRILSGVVYGTSTATNATTHRVQAFQITGPSNVVLVLDQPLVQPYFGNGNGVGNTGINGPRAVWGEPNNGISSYTVAIDTNAPPAITSQPLGSTNILEGGFFTLTVSASGTPPLSYQWRRNGTPIAGATTTALFLDPIFATNAGAYSCVITNVKAGVTSATAQVSTIPSVLTASMKKLWSLAPGSVPYLTTDYTQRGLAYNPVTGRLILVTRAPTNGVIVLNSANGGYLHSLLLTNMTTWTGVGGVTGETFPVNLAGVSDDGQVFVANLGNTANGSGYTIYKWPSDGPAAEPETYFQTPTIGERVGDTLAVFGSGDSLRIAAASRNGTKILLLTNYFGFPLETIVDVTNAPAGFAGLGLAFGGNGATLWGKANGYPFSKVVMDLDNATNDVTTYNVASVVSAIGVDSANQLIAGVSTVQTPDNVQLVDLLSTSVIDQDFFATDNDNINGTGAVAMDRANARFFALDSNNGILALRYAPPLRLAYVGGVLTLTWNGPWKLQQAGIVSGPYTDVLGATSPYAVPAGGIKFYRLTY